MSESVRYSNKSKRKNYFHLIFLFDIAYNYTRRIPNKIFFKHKKLLCFPRLERKHQKSPCIRLNK